MNRVIPHHPDDGKVDSICGSVVDIGNSPMPHSLSRRAHLWSIHCGVRFLMILYGMSMRIAKRIGPPKRPVGRDGCDILLTGTYYSDNWIASHLKPLAMSDRCARIRMVSAMSVPVVEKVEAVYPPPWLIRAIGTVPARLAMFFWEGLRRRPHIVGGFHLLLNGLAAGLLGRLTGAISVYICVGGPREVLDGGVWSDNRIFRRLETPDAEVERRLIKAVSEFDLVITRGHRAISFFRQHGIETAFRVVPGGVDGSRLSQAETSRSIDLITVCRIGPVKRIDLFLLVVKRLSGDFPGIHATVVGDGPLREPLERMARELGIEPNVSFVGQQKNVETWLRKAKVFVLTSDSEGLSLALIEAMRCGLPAVVSDVGELGELVEHGVNGYLVAERTPEAFAAHVAKLLAEEGRLERFSEAARRAAERCDIGAVKHLWNDILPRPGERSIPMGETK